jgi:hypothetical protein
MTSAREERTLGIIPEDSVASVIMVPDIILTPPTDGTGSVEHFFMLAADDELDDEQDIEVRDEMPNNAYIDYVWGGWLGEGEVSDDVDDDDDDESM